ncbi:MAG: PRC-barrel domain containing protein [Candidatus Altiarchaeales archaeon]|nr:PRC-barrel domain containing protein [Candidatus Altiarchaeales archaeon]MBD3416877.1 PRC-barrel domain containing protein [Candidatus Altiarchaeales archaeon]
MFRSMNDLNGYMVEAIDGEVRSVDDILFDDILWNVRYLVANTGEWLPGRQVLIAPEASQQPDWRSRKIPVALTKEQIENSPPLEMDKPVNKQWEQKFVPYYGWTTYWLDIDGDPHLRSMSEVKGYDIMALDGEIGKVEDLIVDDEDWRIGYMVVDTSSWNPLSRKTMIPPEWITGIDEKEDTVLVDVKQSQVKDAPEYNASEPINREVETVLYDYYGKPHYWANL